MLIFIFYFILYFYVKYDHSIKKKEKTQAYANTQV